MSGDGQVPQCSEHYAVHKFVFMVADVVRVQMPKGARLLHVAQQPLSPPGSLCVWAQVDKRQPLVERVLLVYGTGHDMPADPGKHLGTVLYNGGALVYHVFDQGEVR